MYVRKYAELAVSTDRPTDGRTDGRINLGGAG